MKLEGFTPYDPGDAERYNRLRWWLGITWGDLFDKATDLTPAKVGLVDDVARYTYAELRAARWTGWQPVSLGCGIEKGDPVMIQLPNWHEYIFCFFALQKIGAIAVLLIPRHNQIEINHFAGLTGARGWILPTRYGKIDYEPIVDSVLAHNPQLKHIVTVRGEWAGKSESMEK